MHITLFANGPLATKPIKLQPKTFVIAVDGGARHCLNRGIVPGVVIGDFDSLTDKQRLELVKENAEFIPFPPDKDETDLELALTYAMKKGATAITLYGVLGGRWDMSFANIFALANPSYSEIRFHIIEDQTEMFLLRGRETLNIEGAPGDTISVIPLSPTINGLTYTGLEWPLDHAAIPFSSPRGVSNKMLNKKAKITLENGIVLVIVIHKID